MKYFVFWKQRQKNPAWSYTFHWYGSISVPPNSKSLISLVTYSHTQHMQWNALNQSLNTNFEHHENHTLNFKRHQSSCTVFLFLSLIFFSPHFLLSSNYYKMNKHIREEIKIYSVPVFYTLPPLELCFTITFSYIYIYFTMMSSIL